MYKRRRDSYFFFFFNLTRDRFFVTTLTVDCNYQLQLRTTIYLREIDRYVIDFLFSLPRHRKILISLDMFVDYVIRIEYLYIYRPSLFSLSTNLTIRNLSDSAFQLC